MRIAVLGAGYAGLTLVRRLESKLPDTAEIVVVNDGPDHLVQHELHRVIRRPSLAEEITVSLDSVLDRATIREAVVTDIDPDRQVVELDSGASIEYDLAAVCLGAETAFYGLPGVEDHATPLKRLPHAAQIREAFLELCETGGRVVVGGAGLSGVQVAGELAALASEEETESLRDGPVEAPQQIEVLLLEQAETVAPSFPEEFSIAVREELDARGIDVRTGTPLECATGTHLVLADDTEIGYDQFVWTGGIRGPDALGGERARTDASLKIDDHTFAVGDAARVVDAEGAAVPASAAAAVREAHTVADNIAALVTHDAASAEPSSGEGRMDADAVFGPRLDAFRFDAPGWLVSIGDGAVAQIGPSVLRGPAANALKTSVGAGYLGSVGAIRNAAGLVREELSSGRSEG